MFRAYRPEQIKESELQQILEAGAYAPSGMGAQPVIMVVVQDKETIAALGKLNAAVMGAETDPFTARPPSSWSWPTGAGDLAGGRQLSHGKPDERRPFPGPGLLLGPPGPGGLRQRRGPGPAEAVGIQETMPGWATVSWATPPAPAPG